MSEHELKTWPPYFQDIVDGAKTFELRRDDRDFSTGDTLVLQEWDPTSKTYTGREHRVTVVGGLAGPAFGLEAGWVIMSIRSVAP